MRKFIFIILMLLTTNLIRGADCSFTGVLTGARWQGLPEFMEQVSFYYPQVKITTLTQKSLLETRIYFRIEGTCEDVNAVTHTIDISIKRFKEQ